MANALVDIRFIENSRGGRTLVHNNYMFRLKNKRGERSYWNCSLKDCEARINTRNDHITKITGVHNHEADKGSVGAAEIMSSLCIKSRECITPIPSLYEDMLTQLRTPEWDENTECIAESLPTYYTCKSSLYRQRSKLHPAIPKTLEDINLEGKWTETTSGERFLLGDEGTDNRILIFATLENLMELSASETWYMDGTFYSSPSFFTQLYTIHVLTDGYMCPVIYGLLPNKTRKTYERFFTMIQTAADQNNILLNPTTVMMDFEVAAQNSVERVFNTCTVKGCFFHYGQCIWRKVQSCGLVSEFKESDELKQLVRRAAVLPLVPVQCVEDVWVNALEDSDNLDSPPVNKFKDYVTEQWVDGDKQLWNHFDNSGPRTTNHVEGWHHKINTLISHSHPNIYVLLNLIRNQQAANEVRLIQHAAGGKQRPRIRKYRTLDSRLEQLKERLVDGIIDVVEYADAASHLIKLG